jgi:hypothetical protein
MYEKQKDYEPSCDPKAQVVMLSVFSKPLEMSVPKEFGDRHQEDIEDGHF